MAYVKDTSSITIYSHVHVYFFDFKLIVNILGIGGKVYVIGHALGVCILIVLTYINTAITGWILMQNRHPSSRYM